MVILARFWSGHHGQILRGSITSDLAEEPYGKILARYWSGHHGQILRGSIINDLSEPYGNLGKIRHGQILRGSITSDLAEPYGKILARYWSGLHGQILRGSIINDLSEPYGNLGKIHHGQILHGSITSDLAEEPYGKILARYWSGHHGQILRGSSLVTCQNRMVKSWQDTGRVIMAKSCLVASLVTCQNLMVILARFWSGHHGQILRGSITSNLLEPYGNLGKILVRSLWRNLTFKTYSLNLTRF